MRIPGQQEQLRGRRGENRMLRVLCNWRDHAVGDFCRPDFLWVPRNGPWPPFLLEAKDQDAFEYPPFDGHGLGKRQYDVYMSAYRAVGLGTMLFVFDDKARRCYWDFLHSLADGDSFVTNGEKPRIVFPLESFTFGSELA